MNKKILLLSLLAVPALAVAEEASINQADAKGFFAEDSLSILNRNYYLYSDPRYPGVTKSYNAEWAHGVRGEYVSGYTQGALGFGVDAQVYSGIKLDTGRGRNRFGSPYPFYLNPVDSAGDAEDTWSKAGAAVKLRISATELKYGELRPQAPVYSTGDAFLLPETATGFYLASNEVDGLFIEAGHFTAASEFVSTSHDDELLLNYGDTSLGIGDSIDFLGGAYSVNDFFSASLYGSIFAETWNQYYTNLNLSLPVGDEQNLTFDFNMYRTTDTGDSLQGEISNTTFSLAATYSIGAHAITLSHQAVNGDTPFDYIGYDSIWLANSMQYSDFNAPEEQSFRLAYELDMQTLGVPGLIFKAAYTTGEDADGTQADPNGGYSYYGADGEHWERNFEVQYIVPSGVMKDLSLRLRQATHRSNSDYYAGADDDIEEVRFSIEYPWDVL